MSRLLNVYLDYFVIELLTGIAYKRDVLSIILDLCFVHVHHPFGWYVQYLTVCYVTLYLLCRFLKKEKYQIPLMLVIMLVGFGIFYYLNDNLRAEQSVSFFGGVLFAIYVKFHGQISINRETNIFAVGMFVISVALLTLKQTAFIRVLHPEFIISLNLVMKTCAATCIVILSFWFVGKLVLLGRIGKISYALYLVHGYTFFMISNLLCGTWALPFVVFVVVTFAVSVVWYYVLNYVRTKLKTLVRQ